MVSDAWVRQYFSDIEEYNGSLFLTDDWEASEMFPEFRFLYDKLILSKKVTGVKTINLQEELPTKYPVFVKPRVNLLGMGLGAGIAKSEEEIGSRAGMIAQEVLEGDHITADYVIRDGEVIDFFAFESKKDNNGSFILFESIPNYYDSNVCMILRNLNLPNGVVNVETIGSKIIEIHLRPCCQYFDICGGLIQNAYDMMNNYSLTKKYRKAEQVKSYSKIYRRDTDVVLSVSKKDLPKIPSGVSSIQLCWREGLPLSAEVQDSFSFRYMVVNGFDLDAIERHGDNVKKHIRETDGTWSSV